MVTRWFLCVGGGYHGIAKWVLGGCSGLLRHPMQDTKVCLAKAGTRIIHGGVSRELCEENVFVYFFLFSVCAFQSYRNDLIKCWNCFPPLLNCTSSSVLSNEFFACHNK